MMACVILVSSVGRLNGAVLVGITVSLQETNEAVISISTNVDFIEHEVGDNVACVTLGFEDDRIAQGNRVYSIAAEAVPQVEGDSESVMFTRGGDSATFTLIDNDCESCM